MDDDAVQKSRFLSRVLRHRPDALGVALDKQGWVSVDELLEKAANKGTMISRAELERIVAENDKQRFTFNDDHTRIRAAQGHSVSIDLKLPVRTPPAILYHGTVNKFLPSIRKHGLVPGTRQHVHLSATRETAIAVGARRGEPVILVIDTHPMVKAGTQFRQAENGVWLVSCVEPRFIRFPL